ncbi:hypothetical protein GF327_02490 [Candidatus Woesearchaeota archaeon]|nr:hypothetical protein [Candidatus Woesearchaeota archaeon]
MATLKLRYPFIFLSAFLIGVISTLLIIESIDYEQEEYSMTTFTSYVVGENSRIKEEPQESREEKKGSNLMKILGLSNEERPSPYDWIKQDQIHVGNKNIVIDLENAEWAEFTDTNSMDPVIDESAHAIEIVPEKPSDVHIGDIVSYKSSFTDGTIIHRVVRIGFDKKGWYAVFKGDNNPREDPEKVRFSQIRRILVAIIY